MPKIQIKIGEFGDRSFSTIPSGTYPYPQQIVFDSLGRISSITTGSVTSIVVGPNSFTSTNLVTATIVGSTATLSLVSTASQTASNITSIIVDQYGRITSLNTGTVTSTSGAFLNLLSLTTNLYGEVVNVSTSNATSLVITVPSNGLTGGPVFNNLTISGLMTNFPYESYVNYTTGAYLDPNLLAYVTTITCDVSKSSFFQNVGQNGFNNLVIFSLTNVTTIPGKSVAISAMVNPISGQSTLWKKCLNTSTISVNGIQSPLRWLDGVNQQQFDAQLSTYNHLVYSFVTTYDGSTFNTYGSANFFLIPF